MNEKQLEDALRAWPLAELPTGFSASVMEKIKPRPTQTPSALQVQVKFRLTWLDFALGLFFSLLPGLGLISFLSLPQKLILFLKYQWLVFQFPAYQPVLFASIAGIAMLLLLIFALSLRYLLPQRIALS